MDLLTGWPPAPTPHFSAAVVMKGPAVQPAVAMPSSVKTFAPAAPRRLQIGSLDYIDQSDSDWSHGVARKGARGRLGCVLVRKTDDLAKVSPRAVLRFTTGVARCVTAVEPKDNDSNIVVLDGPLDPSGNSFPGRIGIFAPDWSPQGETSFVLASWIDHCWWRGVCNVSETRFRQGLTIETDKAIRMGLATGAQLRFLSSGVRTIIGYDDDAYNNRRVWLDGTVRPMADGVPNDRVATTRRGEPKVAAQAALIALQISEYWMAVLYAAAIIAQRPTVAEGYRLMGRGLLGCNLQHDAAAVLEQGILVASDNMQMRTLLEEALILTGRKGVALAWRSHGWPPPVYGQYVPFDAPNVRKSVRGFGIEADGRLSLLAGSGTLRIVLPEERANRISISIDVQRPNSIGADIDILINLGGIRSKRLLRAMGSRIQTFVIEADLSALEDSEGGVAEPAARNREASAKPARNHRLSSGIRPIPRRARIGTLAEDKAQQLTKYSKIPKEFCRDPHHRKATAASAVRQPRTRPLVTSAQGAARLSSRHTS